MFLLTHIFTSADLSDGLGHPDYALLPQQTQMELFIEKSGVHVRHAQDMRTVERFYNDLVEWDGVTLNEQGEVVGFEFYLLHLPINRDDLNFQLLPSTVERLEALVYDEAEERSTLSFHWLPS